MQSGQKAEPPEVGISVISGSKDRLRRFEKREIEDETRGRVGGARKSKGSSYCEGQQNLGKPKGAKEEIQEKGTAKNGRERRTNGVEER